MSWIHIDDIVGLYLLALDNPEARGPMNGTSPNPVRNIEFGKTLAKVLHRPFLPVGPPDAVLELLLGEVGQVVTKGQRVIPEKAQKLGYSFKHPHLLEALQSVFAKLAAVSKATAKPVAAGHR
jgi:NAD dependent epimerase/dehydratase family enzyme